jgi:hypothetical protein
MWRFTIVLFVLFPFAALADGLCPAQIYLSESTKNIPPGFAINTDGIGLRMLSGIRFFIGRPEKLGEIIPDSPNDYESIWQFAPTDPVWIVCSYRDSGLTLTRQLPPKTTTCRTKWSDPYNGALAGQRLVSSTKCW